MSAPDLASTASDFPLSTEELAQQLKIRPQSIRKRYCETGAYFCLRPFKLPNGRLMWPGNALQQLAGGR